MIKEYIVQATDSVRHDAFARFEDYWAPEQELVRCKDCKYGAKINQVHGDDVMHLCHSSVFSSGKCVHLHDADWFCADGERR